MRFRNPQKLLEPILLDAPEPCIVQGVNERSISDFHFDKFETDAFYTVNAHTMKVKSYRREGFQHTGGNIRLFKTRDDALKDAFNIKINKTIKEIKQTIKLVKAA